MENFLDIAAILSAIIAIMVSGIISYRSTKSLKKVQSELDVQKNIFENKTNYEYDARRKLYENCFPTLFNFISVSEAALFKIRDIVYHIGSGDLIIPGKRFGDEGYNYFKSNTLYKLMAPSACFKILREKITSYDLELDQKLRVQYELGRHLFNSWAGDRDFATIMESEYIRNDDDEFKHREGIRVSELEILCEFFIIRNNGDVRLKRYDEFNEEYKNWKNGIPNSKNTTIPENELNILESLFHNFTIESKPIFWRILVDQARMYLALVLHLEKELENMMMKYTSGKNKDVNIKNDSVKKILLQLMNDYEDKHLNRYLDWNTMNIKSVQKTDLTKKTLVEPLSDVRKYMMQRFEIFSLTFNPFNLKKTE